MDGKTCTKCGVYKSLDDFWRKATSRDGRRSMCSECGQAYNKMYAKQRTGEARRKNRLSSEYGLSPDDFDFLLELQDGGCAICGVAANASGRSMCVDHNHDTGQRRGLLCNRCNWALGYFRDSVDLLRKAIAYLEYHAEPLYWELPSWSQDRELDPDARRQIGEAAKRVGLEKLIPAGW